MPRGTTSTLLLALIVGGLLLSRYRIEGLEKLGMVLREQAGQRPTAAPAAPPLPAQVGPVVRIASFNIQVFGEQKASKTWVMQVLADVVRRFDVVAIQEVRAQQTDVVGQLVAMVNAAGGRYNYVLGPRLGRTSSKEQYAFVYNTLSIELDASSVYTVDDPDDLLHREPLVAGFRVRGPVPEQAFTFTLVNIHTDPDEVATEVNVLDDVVRAVRNDGRGEDDVILLGDLNADHRHLGELGRMPDVQVAIRDIATNTRGNKEYDNLVFSAQATREFSGGAGVFDVQNQYRLSLEQALEVSDHLPIWGEFTIQEGGSAGGPSWGPAPAGPVASGPLVPVR
ncbi:MAG: endonuclease/exonuclease/phosphatase family protein [Pirellulales bacterium]|nr:endonuclease/exonuclease/phosphatase family protein [Pirellulales bacterium]